MSDPAGSAPQPAMEPVEGPATSEPLPAPDPAADGDLAADAPAPAPGEGVESPAPPPPPMREAPAPPPAPGAGAPPPPPNGPGALPVTAWPAPAGGKSRLGAAALALILGGFGLHKFYLGRPGLGIAYLLLCWTGIPAFIGWIEGIGYLVTSDEAWAARYGGPVQRASVAGLGCLWLVAVGPLFALLATIGLIFLGGQVSSILSTTGAGLGTPAPIERSAAPVTPTPGASAPAPSAMPSDTPAPSVDQAALEPLLASLATNPKDVGTLVAAGDVYYRGGAYALASGYYERALAVEPDNVEALLALGATQFNLGDRAGAERSWLRVVAISPDNLEAHYDLGFAYASAVPPDVARARAEWEKVVAADPSSDLGRLAQQALDELAAASSQP